MRLDEFYTPEQDRSGMMKATDTRKPKLTLKILNKMKRVREVKRGEDIEYKKLVKIMYAPPVEGGEAPDLL